MSNFISCKGCTYENHPQKCHPEQGCYEDKSQEIKSFVWDMGEPEPEGAEGVLEAKSLSPNFYLVDKIRNMPFFGKLFDKSKPWKEIVDRNIELETTPVSREHDVELVDIEAIKQSNQYQQYKERTQAAAGIYSQEEIQSPMHSYFIKGYPNDPTRQQEAMTKHKQELHDDVEQLRRDLFPQEPDQLGEGARAYMFPTGILGEKHRLAQDMFNKNRRNLIDNMMMIHGVGFIKINSINPTEVIKPMKDDKCKTCTGNADRMSCPKVINMQADRCALCGMNPLLKDNYEPMPIPWPPEKDQDIWCISARGDIFEMQYDGFNDWVNLVNVYPTEEAANTAVDTLLNARNLPNDEKD